MYTVQVCDICECVLRENQQQQQQYKKNEQDKGNKFATEIILMLI